MSKINIGLVSLGCPKNLVDSEVMLGLVNNNKDYEITADPADADVIIINTCAFIEAATQESINTILEMAEYKKDRCKALIVTGCLSQRYNNELLTEMPEVDAILGVNQYDEIIEVIESLMGNNKDNNKITLCNENSGVDYLNNDRVLSTPSSYAYVKIAEGCDNRCSYCAIPAIRGRYISRGKENIIKEVKSLIDNGVKEIILVAQDTTRYGIDLTGKHELANLLNDICKIDGNFKVRILYCYPQDLTDELIDAIAINDKVCKYIDLPLQHASDKILKAMNRRDTSAMTGALIDKIRARIPNVVLRTTFIVGFPGETDDDVEILAAFIKKYKFERLGVFTYSQEEGTPAARFPDQVEQSVKEERKAFIMEIQKDISKQINIDKLGKTYDTIVESVAEDGIFYVGRTYAEAPDIDGVVYFTSPEELALGQVVNVKFLNYDDYDMIGEKVD